MFKTTRTIAGGTFTTCNDCGHAISMNEICETPLQSAIDMLKHMAAHNSARASGAPRFSVYPSNLTLGFMRLLPSSCTSPLQVPYTSDRRSNG